LPDVRADDADIDAVCDERTAALYAAKRAGPRPLGHARSGRSPSLLSQGDGRSERSARNAGATQQQRGQCPRDRSAEATAGSGRDAAAPGSFWRSGLVNVMPALLKIANVDIVALRLGAGLHPRDEVGRTPWSSPAG